MSLLGGAFRLVLLLLADAAPLLLHGLLLLPQGADGFVGGPSFSRPLLDPPPAWAAEQPAALTLVHVGAHGAGEGETQPGRGLLHDLVGAPEVHGKDVLGQRGGQVNTRTTKLQLVSCYKSVI